MKVLHYLLDRGVDQPPASPRNEIEFFSHMLIKYTRWVQMYYAPLYVAKPLNHEFDAYYLIFEILLFSNDRLLQRIPQ